MSKLRLILHNLFDWHDFKLVWVDDYMTAFDLRFKCACGFTLVSTERPLQVDKLIRLRNLAYDFNRAERDKGE